MSPVTCPRIVVIRDAIEVSPGVPVRDRVGCAANTMADKEASDLFWSAAEKFQAAAAVKYDSVERSAHLALLDLQLRAYLFVDSLSIDDLALALSIVAFSFLVHRAAVFSSRKAV